MRKKNLIFLFLFVMASFPVEAKLKATILPGAFQTDLYFPLIRNKVIGVVANQTSILGTRHLVDTLKASGFNIKCVFAPEHGFRGDKAAGETVQSGVDSITGLPVISLYGKHLAPDSSDLNGIDVMLFDIQDVGVRFYTYISTLQLVMEACAEHNIPLILLDRPNPNGFYVDGPVLERKFSSFVGLQPVPVVYGMTLGEYAKMLIGEKWLRTRKKCDLMIVPVKNYYHSSKYQLPIPPSPNLPDMEAVYLYPSLCFFEGTAISLGRGTEKPFRIIGFPGNQRDSFSFTPLSIPGVALHPPYQDTTCTGIDLSDQAGEIIKEPRIRLTWLIDMYSIFPAKESFFNNFFDQLAGTQKLRTQLVENKSEEEIRKSWEPGIKKFKEIRKKYVYYIDFE
jgi:uncharacterized protein YbbC (DUF1343 family)